MEWLSSDAAVERYSRFTRRIRMNNGTSGGRFSEGFFVCVNEWKKKCHTRCEIREKEFVAPPSEVINAFFRLPMWRNRRNENTFGDLSLSATPQHVIMLRFFWPPVHFTSLPADFPRVAKGTFINVLMTVAKFVYYVTRSAYTVELYQLHELHNSHTYSYCNAIAVCVKCLLIEAKSVIE